MARHIYIHFHDEQGREADGKFAAGGSGHALKTHSTMERAVADYYARKNGIEAHGFKFERAEDDPVNHGTHNHYKHPDGRRAVISHGKEALTGRHKVHSYINTMNQGKK